MPHNITSITTTHFEHELMVNLLDDPQPFFEELRLQFDSASVLRREKSSFSSTTYFRIPNEFKPMKTRNKTLKDYKVEVMESNQEILATLFIRDGYLSHLELSKAGGNFPADLSFLAVYKDHKFLA